MSDTDKWQVSPDIALETQAAREAQEVLAARIFETTEGKVSETLCRVIATQPDIAEQFLAQHVAVTTLEFHNLDYLLRGLPMPETPGFHYHLLALIDKFLIDLKKENHTHIVDDVDPEDSLTCDINPENHIYPDITVSCIIKHLLNYNDPPCSPPEPNSPEAMRLNFGKALIDVHGLTATQIMLLGSYLIRCNQANAMTKERDQHLARVEELDLKIKENITDAPKKLIANFLASTEEQS